MEKTTLYDGNFPVGVPLDVAKCPICDAALIVREVGAWEVESGKPVEITVECVDEPDIWTDEADEFFRVHYKQPYIDWLPVEHKVMAWFQKIYVYAGA